MGLLELWPVGEMAFQSYGPLQFWAYSLFSALKKDIILPLISSLPAVSILDEPIFIFRIFITWLSL